MTANQINYVKHLEDVRSHKVNEALAARQAAASEVSAASSAKQALTAEKNAETNVLNSETNRLSAEASQLSALASQTMAAASYMNAETERMYKEASVMLEASKQQEAARHNAAVESKDLLVLGETKRHNEESEWLSMFDTTTKSGIAAADRGEKAREADQSAAVTKRGQNLGILESGMRNVTDTINKTIGTAGSILQTGINAVSNIGKPFADVAAKSIITGGK